jgi:ABC-2 type transport system permease protein
VTLFGFFWVEAFFARNIADVRPLFRWMPVLLVFLVAEFSVQDLIERTMQDFIEVPPTPIPAPSVGPTAAP